ncbi:MAG: insulinase family protein [Planctomycetes bacterium]|nr:insulinase family protein [Planctomycetota bacterium]
MTTRTQAPTIHQHRFANGLTLVVEPIASVASAAMTLLTPAGITTEPADRQGVGAILSEMIFRGAGELDARQHSDALDQLGVHRSGEVLTHHMRLGATMMGDRIDAALPLLLDMIRRPRLDETTFEPSRQLAITAIDSLEDNPQHKVMIELKRQHVGDPMGRSTMGLLEHLENLTHAQVVSHYKQRCVADGAIIGLAGNVEFEKVRDQIGELLGDWSGSAKLATPNAPPPHTYHHIEADTTQQHIGLAYDTVGELDPMSMTQRVAVAVLSGGMSGRLFTEVREVRGLCYSVYASYGAQRERGVVYAYAGTTTQRAAETLSVLRGELIRLADGVERDEFDRAIVGLKARLVMQGESTSARASAIAGDQFLRGRPRTLDDVAAEIDAVTLDKVNDFVAAHRAGDFTTLNIGPDKLDV